jgi:hypothetical protein
MTADSTKPNSPGVDVTLTRPGGLSYVEIPALDVRQSAVFYQSVCGWRRRGDDPNEPRFSDPSGHLIGRWITDRAISRKPGLLPFIYVDRIDQAIQRVVPSGGEIVKPAYREGDTWVALVRDPAGNILGLWQASGQ